MRAIFVITMIVIKKHISEIISRQIYVADWRYVSWYRNLAKSFTVLALTGLMTSSAITMDLPFGSGAVVSGETCSISLINPGTLASNVGNTILGSKETGGVAGSAVVTSRKHTRASGTRGPRFRVSFEPPSSFTSAPATGNDNVVFSTRMSGTAVGRGTTFGERNGTNSRQLRRGGTDNTRITAHLIATKSTGTFAAGTYQAEGVLRCE